MATINQLFEVLASTSKFNTDDSGPVLVTRAREILKEIPCVPADMSNEQVRLFLQENGDTDSVAVVDDQGFPIGLINRSIFLEAYARPFAREVFGKRSCIAWMDKDALAIDQETPIEILVKAAVAKGAKVLKDGFIGTREGRYAGLGTGFSLMEAMEALEAAKTRQLLDSIDYASTIQRSHLRESDLQLAQVLEDRALLWMPRDVVGGDCYFFRNTAEGLFGAIIDCTGHGVPGAFMTLIALSFFEQRVGSLEFGTDPGRILTGLNKYIKKVLAQEKRGHHFETVSQRSDDGMDAACFLLPREPGRLVFSSARIPLILVEAGSGTITIVDGEREGIGYVDTADDYEWQSKTLEPPAKCRIFLTTDGAIDQIGGAKNIALGRKRLCEWLKSISSRSSREIGERFPAFFMEWQGEQARRDDLTLFVFTPGSVE